MIQDLKQAIRALLQTKGWTAVVLLTLALGIGANTALFTGINGLLLRTVPVPNPDTLVRLGWAGKNEMQRSSSGYGFTAKNAAGEEVFETISYPAYQALIAANQTLTGIAAGAPASEVSVVYEGRAELASAYLASGINVPGKTVTLGALTAVIVGVTPPELSGIHDLTAPAPDLTLPLAMDRQLNGTRVKDGWNWWVQTFGRLKPGVTLEQVRANLDGTFQAAALEGWTSYFTALSAEDKGLAIFPDHPEKEGQRAFTPCPFHSSIGSVSG